MTLKILIKEDGRPYYYEEPDKPECDCDEVDGAGDFESKHDECDRKFKAYEIAVAQAKQSAVSFIKKDQGLAMKLIYGNPNQFIDGLPVNYFEWLHNAKGKVFDLPLELRGEKFRVRIIEENWQDRCRKNECLGECGDVCAESFNKEVIKFATLLPIQETKPPLFFTGSLCDMHQRPACAPNERVDCKCEWIAFERQKVVAPSEEVKPEVAMDKGAEEILRSICDKQFGGDFGGVDGDDWNKLLKENSDEGIFMRSAIQAMQEYAAQERLKARENAIDNVIEFCKDWYENERSLEGKDFYTELEKLKK